MFDYPENWDDISKDLRKSKFYICQNCRFDFSHHTRLLDVHHIDGIPGNIEQSNLKVLCKECHSNEPSHGHYKKVIQKELELIKQIKKGEK
mgnify:CR=1 FL=1